MLSDISLQYIFLLYAAWYKSSYILFQYLLLIPTSQQTVRGGWHILKLK